jgi:TolA-binding protein
VIRLELVALVLAATLTVPLTARAAEDSVREHMEQAERDYRRMERDAQLDRIRREQRNQADDQSRQLREIEQTQREILDRLNQGRSR